MMNVNEQANEYHLMPNGDFVIANYQQKKTFASFLPGIAGLHGIPLWVFYVNRGQGVASFGVADKDHAIMEFEAANKAYQRVPTQGFRTWIRTRGDGQPSVHEPFRRLRRVSEDDNRPFKQTFWKKRPPILALKPALLFYSPRENFGALVRKVTITNQNKNPQTLEVLQYAVIIPYGLSNQALKRWPTPQQLGPGPTGWKTRRILPHLCHCRPGGRGKGGGREHRLDPGRRRNQAVNRSLTRS